jgi:hypothetical protein
MAPTPQRLSHSLDLPQSHAPAHNRRFIPSTNNKNGAPEIPVGYWLSRPKTQMEHCGMSTTHNTLPTGLLSEGTVLSAFPAVAPQHHGAHTVLTGLLDRSALPR